MKGHNYATNLRKMTNNNPNLHLVNINGHTKVGQLQSIRAENEFCFGHYRSIYVSRVPVLGTRGQSQSLPFEVRKGIQSPSDCH